MRLPNHVTALPSCVSWDSHVFVPVQRLPLVLVGAAVCVLLAMPLHADALKYDAERAQIVKNENLHSMSGSITFTKDEDTMVAVMKKLKTQEYHDFDEDKFLPAQTFLDAKKDIETSSLFSFLRAMPKGTSLHTHILAATSAEYIVNTLSYMEELYMFQWNGKLKLKFMNATDAEACRAEYGQCDKLSEKRQHVGAKEFDAWLLKQLTITNDDSAESATNKGLKTKRWTKLSGIFTTLYDMLTYRPAFEAYLSRAMQELVDDNVLFVEFRGTFMEFYELDGTKYDAMQSLQIMSDAITSFTTQHNETFLGARYIFAPYRKLTDDDFQDCLKLLREAHRKHPHLVAGFDLVGHEDAGGALRQRVEQLQRVHKDIRFYFHAGETNWQGTEADENLLDAILLGSSRIGHALSLAKHPELMRVVRERRVAIEVAPVSNQVLGYVPDLRAHPAALYARFGIPIVICNDDPTAFGNAGLTYDFYEAFMAFTHVGEGPEFLKAAALNSIGHSSMNHVQKRKAYEMFEEQWKIWSHAMLAITKFFGKLSHK